VIGDSEGLPTRAELDALEQANPRSDNAPSDGVATPSPPSARQPQFNP
jgi:hypothetical protein